MAARRSLRAPLGAAIGAGAIALTVYIANSRPAKLDDTPYELAANPPSVAKEMKLKDIRASGTSAPFTPLAWGSNAYCTLINDADVKGLRRPTPMTHLGGTPLRDLVIHEKYGAALDARGDLWMWGKGFDESGETGRSLRGKKLTQLIPAPGKLFGLSKDGRLYVVSADRAIQDQLAKSRGYWKKLTTRDPIVDFVELRPGVKFYWGEKFTSVSAGQHHLLASTNHGRTFSLPLTPDANTHRQLGTKQTFEVPATLTEALAASPPLRPEVDARFATQLTEIPALSGVNIAQVAASDRSSFARTAEGRVLGFGANDFGQIGLGNTTTVSTVPTPVEIVLAKAYPAGSSVKCTNIAAGAMTTFFTVEQKSLSASMPLVDILSCGNGQHGTLGTGMWSSAAYAPSRIKALSSLQEYSEKEQGMIPLAVTSLSIAPSPATHVFAVLDTLRSADPKLVSKGMFGKDVLVWGGNTDAQLGNGKRSALATPTNLPPMVPHASDDAPKGKGEKEDEAAATRLQLHGARADAFDPYGKLIKRGVRCEETVVAGWNCSVLYNKIVEK